MKTNLRQFCTAMLAVIVFTLFCGSIVHADTIYVYGDAFGTIDKVNSSGQKSTFASGSSCYFLTCDSSGNLYAANSSERTIDKYNSSGYRTTLASFPSAVYPMGLAFDNNGYLYASLQGEHGNALDNTIVKLDSSGNRTTFASGLNMPLSLAFDGSSHFYTIDSSGDSIKKIDMSGNISTFASGLSLNYTFGLACDSSGNLYMTDALDGTIKKFDSSGNMSIFASGLNTPMNLAFGSNNNLYVTDGDSSGEPGSLGIILKFDSSGNRSVFATGLDDVPAGIAIYVPEPASMAILALGGLALLGQKRK